MKMTYVGVAENAQGPVPEAETHLCCYFRTRQRSYWLIVNRGYSEWGNRRVMLEITSTQKTIVHSIQLAGEQEITLTGLPLLALGRPSLPIS